MGTAVADSLARVTVVTAQREVDVALPPGRSVAELVDELRPLLGAPPVALRLARVGEAPMAPGKLLGDYDVGDGEVLHLVEEAHAPPPAVLDDPVELVQTESVVAGRWTPARLALALASGGGVVAAAGAGAVLLAGAERAWGLAGGLSVALLVVAGVLRLLGRPLAGVVAASVAVPYAAVGGLGAVGIGSDAEHLTATGAALALSALLAALLAPRVTAPLVAVGALGATAGAAGALVVRTGLEAPQVAGIMAVVWVMLVALLPTATARSTGLVGWDAPPQHLWRTRVARARSVLGWLLVAGSAVVAVAAFVLALDGDRFALGLVVSLALLLGLRTRRFARTWDAIPLLCATAALTLTLAAVQAGGERGLALPLLWVLLAVGALLVGLSVVLPGRGVSARAQTRLDRLETLVMLTVAPLLAGVLQLYELADRLGRSL